MIKIEIDGQALEVEAGSNIIQAADKAGIYIPRFCYHEKLTVAANCRMCLVEVEKAPKTLPACATPVTEGMKVFTQSAKTIESQKAVMEFLLINHPLDCPICDQGGQCELQDLALEYGADASKFDETKRAVVNKDLGPLIATEMTRCIHCTRCLRFGDEIAGMRELGGMGRGEDLEIGTYVQHLVCSELSGNVIDICPVGALTSKPFRFKARAWEMTQHASIAPHDGVGSHLSAQSLRGEFLKVVPREAASINEVWISDRDRFSYLGVQHQERLTQPMIKKSGRFVPVDWAEALTAVKEKLSRAMGGKGGALAALASPHSTLEELFLFQKWIRGLGSDNIDHRLSDADFRDQDQFGAYPGLPLPIAEIENQKTILLVGANLRREQPILGWKVRKACLKGAKVFAINPQDYSYHFPLAGKSIVPPSEMVGRMSAILEALENKHRDAFSGELADALRAGSACILLGEAALTSENAASLRTFTQKIASLTQAKVGILTPGPNTAGAWLAGALPHRGVGCVILPTPGAHARAMFESPRSAYVLLNLEPEADLWSSHQALKALKAALCVVVLTPYVTEQMQDYAEILLPISTFGETSGSFVNLAGTWQSFEAFLAPPGEARPAWKVLRALAQQSGLAGFDYTSLAQLREEVKQRCSHLTTDTRFTLVEASKQPGLELIATKHLYASDSIVRRSAPLQAMITSEDRDLAVAEDVASQYRLKTGDRVKLIQGLAQLELRARVDASLAPHCVQIYLGLAETQGFSSGGQIRLEKLMG